MDKMEKDLLKYTELAWSILNKNTPYKTAKQAIRNLFETSFNMSPQKIIALRLTVIDSYYSTNMNRRYYGIEDIAIALINIGQSDRQILDFFKNYIKQPLFHKEGNKLFNRKYGISKTAIPSKRAPSLLSKYAYFHTKYNFPIYDSLAKQSYRILSKAFPNIVKPCSKLDDMNYFFHVLSKLNEKIHNYDKLDNLLWLIGKIKVGNLSFILKKENYKQLIYITKQVPKYDMIIKLSEQNHKFISIIGEDLCKFISFVATLPQ